MERIRTYTEMAQIGTFEGRYEYLKLGGSVGHATFGFDRYINQSFYTSREWRNVRDVVIVRDRGCDLGIPGREINGGLIIHHVNPMTAEDILEDRDWILNPDFLVATSTNTHNAIHYGDGSLLVQEFVPRSPGDTKLW